jgi:hypothetical protein
VPAPGTVSAAAATGCGKEPLGLGVEGRKEGLRRSKRRIVPSLEQEAIRSGWCGLKRAW